MTTMMSPSPALSNQYHSRPHTPLNLSPVPSPSLRPSHPLFQPRTSSPSVPSASIPSSSSLPPLSMPSSHIPQTPESPRSYARAPTQRPYASPLASRGRTLPGGRGAKEISGDTLRFAELVVELINQRAQNARKDRKDSGLGLSLGQEEDGEGEGKTGKEMNQRKTKSLAGSLAGSWESERAELIVDIPVWSPGCFQDLSTLHSLRDTTLSHTHSLLSHLIGTHNIPSSYRLLARSAEASNACRQSGWGCIRLAPSSVSPRAELKPKVRRSSMDINKESPDRDRTNHRSTLTKALQNLTMIQSSPNLSNSLHSSSHSQSASPRFKGISFMPSDALIRGISPAGSVGSGRFSNGYRCGDKTPELWLEEAIADDDEDEEAVVRLKTGYRSGSVSDSDEDEDADELVAREVQRRGAKEGTAFLMVLFGGPALILV